MRKSRFAALFAAIAMAVALCPGFALAAEGGLQSELLRAQDSSLPDDLGNQNYQVRLDGNEADWLVFYVDGKDGAYSPKAELFYQDEPVDPNLYELKWRVSRWIGDDEVFEDTSLPLKMSDADPEGEYSGIGDTYQVVAVPAAGSPLKGESRSTEANVADKYTFNFFGKTAQLEGGYENDALVPGMHQGFEADASEAKGFRVFESAVNSEGAEIDPQYYDVEYYNRKPGPYNRMEEGWEEGLRVERDPLGGFPKKAGTYFAVIKAKAPYFGEAVVDFDLIGNFAPSQNAIRLDGEGQEFFSDGVAHFKVSAESTVGEEDVDWNVVVAVGLQGTFDDKSRTFSPAFDKGEYIYDAASKVITLNGGKIFESAGIEGEVSIAVRAWIADKDGNVLCEDVQWISCLEARADCDHEWGAPTYVWASDNCSVSASRTCTNCDLVESEVATVAVMTTPATYAAEGKTVYTATFSNPAFETQTKTVPIAKLQRIDQSLKVTASTKTLKAKKLKKKAQTLSLIKVAGAQGTVSYKVASVKGKSKKALKLNTSTGKITVKKGAKKGAYSMEVTVFAAGTEKHNVASQAVTVKIKVK